MLTFPWQESHCNESSQKVEEEKWYICHNVQTSLFYPKRKRKKKKTVPWIWHLINIPLILVLAFRPHVPVILGFGQIDEMLVNSV